MKKVMLICLVLFLCSCSPSTPETVVVIVTATSTSTPVYTATPTITPTATKIPLADIDLEPILVQEGDLPAGYSGAQIRDFAGRIFDDLPPYLKVVSQEISHSDDSGGYVSVFLYTEKEDIDSAYSFINEIMFDENKEIAEIGELSHGYAHHDVLLGKYHVVEMLFRRCNSVVYINLDDTYNLDDGIGYAKRLDKRLQPLVCP